MKSFDAALYKLLYWICSLLMFSMAFLIFVQVVARYVFQDSLTWSEEIGRYIFVWMSFLGMAVAIKAKAHVALDILLKNVNYKMKKIITCINAILVSCFAIGIIYSGCLLVDLGGRQRSAALELPMDMIYMIIPISGVLMLYFTISATIAYLKEQEADSQ